MNLINWNLIIHPVNWLIILAVLYFVALLAQMLYQASKGASLIPFPNASQAS